jgi:hypothetical protein
METKDEPNIRRDTPPSNANAANKRLEDAWVVMKDDERDRMESNWVVPPPQGIFLSLGLFLIEFELPPNICKYS